MNWYDIPISDWVCFAVGLFGLLMAYLQSRDRLPWWVRKWLACIGKDRILDAIENIARRANTWLDDGAGMGHTLLVEYRRARDAYDLRFGGGGGGASAPPPTDTDRQEAGLELACESGQLPGAAPADI